MNSYLTLRSGIYRHEIVVEKSRFIATVCQITNVEEVSVLLKAVAKEYAGATHHCYAYLTTDGQKYADDGEPQGTAGLPILQAISHQDLLNVVVVVTRYFGGIKLGTGGLTRAYGRVAAEALSQAPKVRMQACVLYRVTGDYTQVSTLENIAKELGKILTKDYQTGVAYEIAVPCEKADLFGQKLTNALHGKINCVKVCEKMVEFTA